MRIVTVKLPEVWIQRIDQLVRKGRYYSRSEFIREAVRKLLWEEIDREEEEMKRRLGIKRFENIDEDDLDIKVIMIPPRR